MPSMVPVSWPMVLAVVLLIGAYVYAWWVFLPRFEEDYGEERGPLLLVFFLAAPFLFIAAGALARAMDKKKEGTKQQLPANRTD